MAEEKTFDPSAHLMDLKGKAYLPAAARVYWFREEHGIETGWEIRTTCVEGSFKEGYAVYRAEIVNPEGRVVATGTNAEDKQGFVDFVMKAETGSIARALALCGYGTAAALDEGEIVDTPIQRSQQKAPQGQRRGQAPAAAQSRARDNAVSLVGAATGDSSPKAGSLAEGADADEVAPVIWCQSCGGEIKRTQKRSAAEVARLSRELFGDELCVHCVDKRQRLASANLPEGQIAA